MASSRPNTRGGRYRAACDLCRRKKIHCDGDKPACENCRLAKVACTFTARPSQNKSAKEQLIDARARIQELEQQLAEQRQLKVKRSLQSTLPQLRIRDPSDFDAALDIFHWHLGFSGPLSPSSPGREAFLSTIHLRTGCQFDLHSFSRRIKASYISQYPSRKSRLVCPKWPGQELIQRCITYYMTENLYSVFPMIHPSTLQSSFDEYCSNSRDEKWQMIAQARFVSFTAFVTQIHRHHPGFAEAEPDSYIQAALTLLPYLILVSNGTEALEAILIIALYITPTGSTPSGQLLLSIAVRKLYNLGAYHRSPNVVDPETHSHLRAVFWMCYAMDKEMCIRSSQPPLIHDTDCDLTLPPNYVERSSDRQFLSEPLSQHILLYPSDLRLSILKSKIYRLLYSVEGQSQPQARRLESIRQLDAELTELRSTFPVHFQPDPTAYLDPDYKLHDFSIRGMNIHLEYYSCVRKIHEAGIVDIDSISQPLPSSVELYHHAARSTLHYFLRGEGLVQAPTVWIHAQFILSSALALFWNIIQSPSAASVDGDIQLLQEMKVLFRRLCENCWEGAPLPPLYIFEEFLGMLVDLAGICTCTWFMREEGSTKV